MAGGPGRRPNAGGAAPKDRAGAAPAAVPKPSLKDGNGSAVGDVFDVAVKLIMGVGGMGKSCKAVGALVTPL